MNRLNLHELKDESLDLIIEKLQGNEAGQTKMFKSFRDQYEQLLNSNELNLNKLISIHEGFEIYLENFIIIQNAFLIRIREEKKSDEISVIQSYIEFTNIYINSIQGIYLNQVSQRINQIEFNTSIGKSNKSIRLAWIGIFIGAIFSWGASAYYYQVSRKDQNKYESQLEERIILDRLNVNRLEEEKRILQDRLNLLDQTLKMKSGVVP
jgi:hypothetical protein